MIRKTPEEGSFCLQETHRADASTEVLEPSGIQTVVQEDADVEVDGALWVQFVARLRGAVERFAQELARIDISQKGRFLDRFDEKDLFDASVTVLMRLVFLATAQERGLLSTQEEACFLSVHALHTQLRETRLRESRHEDLVSIDTYEAWPRLLEGFRTLFCGSHQGAFVVPAFGGPLFDPERYPFLKARQQGQQESRVPVKDSLVLCLLDAILVLPSPQNPDRPRSRVLPLEPASVGMLYEELLHVTLVRVPDVMVGLHSRDDGCCYVPLAQLETHLGRGERALLTFLKRQTGLTKKTLQKAMGREDTRWNQPSAHDEDGALYARLAPYAGLLRIDEDGRPAILQEGDVHLSRSATRRLTGAHYTPYALAHDVVHHTLVPLVFEGPGQGWPEARWRRHSSDTLLALKICDLAMGCGIFLLQACRVLARHLRASWLQESEEGQDGAKQTLATLRVDGEAGLLIAAKRAVAASCLYGVDRDPMAVALAKLTLWLEVSEPGRSMARFEHALRCGDSLLGAARSEGVASQEAAQHTGGDTQAGGGAQNALPFHWPVAFPEVFDDQEGFDAIVGNPPFMGGRKISSQLGKAVRQALMTRFGPHARGNADLCAFFFLRTAVLLRPGGCFGLIATNTIAQGDTRKTGLAQMTEISIYRATPSRKWPGDANLEVAQIWGRRGPWHGKHILQISETHGKLCPREVPGINTFLDVPGRISGTPYRLKRPEVQAFQGSIVLGMGFVLQPQEAHALLAKDPRNQDVILPYLNGRDLNTRPDQSASRYVISFFDWPLRRASAQAWRAGNDPQRKAWQTQGIVAPDYDGPVAADYPDCLAILEARVKPERQRTRPDGSFKLRKPLPQRWWQHAEKRPALYHTIAQDSHTLVKAQISQSWAFAIVPNPQIFDQKLVVFHNAPFCVLQSSFHQLWNQRYSSTLGKYGQNYILSDSFETFPFPPQPLSPQTLQEKYVTLRHSIMQDRQEGLTSLYNRFHNPNEQDEAIRALRALHMRLDHAVADAYGWFDHDTITAHPDWQPLSLQHDFIPTPQGIRFTIHPTAQRESLDRLLALNHTNSQNDRLLPPAAGGEGPQTPFVSG